MKSVLNKEVSRFANYESKVPESVNLLTFLTSNKYVDKVRQIREIEDKDRRDELKATLPAITPSGLFSPSRKAANLVRHSGLIQFDIDQRDNPCIDVVDLKKQLAHIKEVAYCGFSVSGRGLWGLVPIQWPEKHKEHLRALQRQLSSFGVALDSAPSSVVSLRGYSFDSDGYFNHTAKRFTLIDQPERRPVTLPRFSSQSLNIEKLEKWLKNKGQYYTKGNRNEYLYRLAAACCRCDISKDEAYNYILCNYDLPEREVNSLMRSAYR